MPRNKEDFNAGYYGPAQRVKVTPSAADADATGTEAYSFDVHPEAGSKSVGKHIARAIKGGLPKPEKVEFNKE
jgi:hypothetical protein